jgi:hypothetical protein
MRPKHFEPRTLTEDGMQIDFSEKHSKKTCSPISRSSDPDSNDTAEREVHTRKHPLHRIAAEAGMQINSSDLQHENASSSIRRN